MDDFVEIYSKRDKNGLINLSNNNAKFEARATICLSYNSISRVQIAIQLVYAQILKGEGIRLLSNLATSPRRDVWGVTHLEYMSSD